MNKTKKTLQGEIIKLVDEKTAKVEVESKSAHPLYKRIMKSHKKYLVDKNSMDVNVGDNVKIEETRPISKTKHFKIIEIVK